MNASKELMEQVLIAGGGEDVRYFYRKSDRAFFYICQIRLSDGFFGSLSKEFFSTFEECLKSEIEYDLHQ